MKEVFRPTPIELTKPIAQPKLERGTIFMNESGEGAIKGVGSQAKTPSASAVVGHQAERRFPIASPGRQADARSEWEAENARWRSQNPGKEIGLDTLSSQEFLIQHGIPPVEGGAGGPPPINPGTFINPTAYASDEVLHGIAQDALLIQDLGQLGEIIQRLNRVKDQRGLVDRALAQRLTQELRNMDRAISPAVAQQQRERERERNRFIQYIGAAEQDDLESGDRGKIMGWLLTAFDRLYQRPIQGALQDSREFQDFEAAYREARRIIKDAKEKQARQDPVHQREHLHELNSIYAEMDNVFDTTYRNIVMSATIRSSGKMEQLSRAAELLRGHYLFNGFTIEDGNVGAMYQMIDDYAETKRLLSANQHLMSDTITQVNGENPESEFMQYQIRLAMSGNGPFARKPQETEEDVRNKIVRAARTAYNLWVNTQRQAVIGSRGRKFEAEQFQTDPVGGPFTFYNPEEFFAEKWWARTAEELFIKEATKLALAHDYLEKNHPGLNLSNAEVRELADRLFRDFVNIPDLFSGGWRMEKIFEAIQDRCIAVWGEGEYAKQRAENMALFLRIKQNAGGRPAGKYTGREHKKRSEWENSNRKLKGLWEKVAQFHPEEIVRLWQERIADDVTAEIPVDDSLNSPNRRFRYSPRCQNLYRRFHTMFTEGDRDSNVFIRNEIKHYKDFKEFKVRVNGEEVLLSTVLNTIRQEGYSMLEQANFARPEPWVVQMLEVTLGRDMAQEVIAMYAEFSRFSQGSVDDLMKSDKFEDLYLAGSKVLKTDDTLLNQLELKNFSEKTLDGIRALASGRKRVMINGREYGLAVGQTVNQAVADRLTQSARERHALFKSLSQKYSPGEGRGDVYIRTLTDSISAEAALTTHMYEIFHAEGVDGKAKAAEAFYNAVKNYNGIDNAIQGVLYTLGVYIDLASLDTSLDIFGVGGRPLRQAASGAQRILGPQAEALSQDKRLEVADHFRRLFVGTGQDLLKEEEKRLPPEQQEELRRERMHEAEQGYRDLREKTRTRRKDIVGKKFWELLWYFLFAAGVEAYNTVDVKSLVPKAA